MTSNNLDGKTLATVDLGKVLRDAFIDANTFLYIPVDAEGTVVDVEKAHKLLCWKVSEGYTESPLPDLITSLPEIIPSALLRLQGDASYGTLARSIAFGSIGKMECWLKTLIRDPEGDRTDLVIYKK